MHSFFDNPKELLYLCTRNSGVAVFAFHFYAYVGIAQLVRVSP